MGLEGGHLDLRRFDGGPWQADARPGGAGIEAFEARSLG
jgi:hypothetical protein